MWILGIDPGTRIMGWGLIHLSQGQELLGPGGQIRPKGRDLSKKLGQIYAELCEIIQEHRPQTMVIESVFVHINSQSALTLGYARGVAMAVAGQNNVAVVEYAPTAIKKSLTGYGHATKDQMVAMIARLFSIHALSPDTADAYAGALCHARHAPFLHKS
jgi:crossover junction endodeoxyribonuclease RuvC